MTKKKLLDVAGGQYVEAVSLVDSNGYAINSSYPLCVRVENATAIPVAETSATPTHIVSAASTNATSIKASSAKLYNVYAINTAASDRYVKVYNKASAPVVGTDVPIKTIKVPATGVANLSLSVGTTLNAGLAIAIVAGAGNADATAVAAGDVILDIDYI